MVKQQSRLKAIVRHITGQQARDNQKLRAELKDILRVGMTREQPEGKQACIKALVLLQTVAADTTCCGELNRLRFDYINELQAFALALIWRDWKKACGELYDLVYFNTITRPPILWAVVSQLELYLKEDVSDKRDTT